MSHPSEKCTASAFFKHVAIISAVTVAVIVIVKKIRK